MKTKVAMDKPTKKRQTYNAEVIKAISEEYCVTKQFVRQCIRKEKHSLTADTIRKKYIQMNRATEQAIKEFKQKPL